MGFLSAFLNVRVVALKPLYNDDEKIIFLMATQDGFKERLFECVLFPVVPVEHAKDIQKAVQNIPSTRFYAPLDEIRDGVPVLMREHHEDSIWIGIGRLSVREFGTEQLQTYGKSKQWFK